MSYTNDRLKRNMEKAREIFLQEVKDRLPEAVEALDNLKKSRTENEAIQKLYKYTHTLKGSSETIWMFEIAHPASEMNTVLKLLMHYDVKLDYGVIHFLTERLEEINEVINKDEIAIISSELPRAFDKSKRIIYVIDDDETVTSLVENALSDEGFKVIVFHGSKEAEQYISIERPDLIILDIILSTEDEGINFCHTIRSKEYSKLIPIIFLTIKNQLNDKLKGFAIGGDDYVGKPFQVEELVARTYSILNRLEVNQDLILQDELTKVYNRRYLDQRLTEEIAKAKRTGNDLAIAMIDIDYFKRVNDNYGHSVGDETLRALVELLRENIRKSDVICRYGGEEFIIIFPDTPKTIAYVILERIRNILSDSPLRLSKSNITIMLTISIGIAGFTYDTATYEDLINSADNAMYASKEAGRNKVTLAKGEIA